MGGAAGIPPGTCTFYLNLRPDFAVLNFDLVDIGRSSAAVGAVLASEPIGPVDADGKPRRADRLLLHIEATNDAFATSIFDTSLLIKLELKTNVLMLLAVEQFHT